MMTKPRLLSVSLAAVLSVSLLAVQPASALTVFDPSNFVQNTLTAVRTLEQINNQINQLQNEAQMLMNQPEHGKSRLQHRQPPALDARHHRAPDRRGARLGLRRAEHGCHVRPPVPGTVRLHHQRRPHGTGCPRTLAEHLERPAHRDADAGAGVAEPRPRRKRAGRPREPEPVGHRRAASDAGDEPARLCRPSSRSGRSSSRSRKTGPLRWNWRGKRRLWSAPAKCGGASSAPARRTRRSPSTSTTTDRRRPCDALPSCWPCC